MDRATRTGCSDGRRPASRPATAVAALALLAAACGGGDGESDARAGPATGGAPPPAASGGYAAIVGLYDASREGDGGLDVGYVEFAPEGTFTAYDYRQDAVNLGPNCSLVLGPVPVTPLGGDRYAVGPPGDATELVVTPSEVGIIVTETRTEVVNGFPQIIGVGDELARVTAFTSTDLVRCPEGE